MPTAIICIWIEVIIAQMLQFEQVILEAVASFSFFVLLNGIDFDFHKKFMKLWFKYGF